MERREEEELKEKEKNEVNKGEEKTRYNEERNRE